RPRSIRAPQSWISRPQSPAPRRVSRLPSGRRQELPELADSQREPGPLEKLEFAEESKSQASDLGWEIGQEHDGARLDDLIDEVHIQSRADRLVVELADVEVVQAELQSRYEVERRATEHDARGCQERTARGFVFLDGRLRQVCATRVREIR